eukprot:PhM_4_TR5188/c0_g1_i9/m.99167
MSWEQSILLPLTERNARRRKVVGHVSCPHYYIRCIVRVAVDPVSALRWATRHRGAGGRCARRHVLQHVGGMQHRWPRLCAGHTPPTGVRRRQAQPAHVSVHAARGLSVHDVWFRCRCDLVQHRDYPRPPPPGPERGGGRGCLRPHLHPVPCARHCLRSRAQATAGRRGDDAVVRRLRRRRTDHARRLPTVHPHDGDGRRRRGVRAVSRVVHVPAVGGGHRAAQGCAPRRLARLLPRGAQRLARVPCAGGPVSADAAARVGLLRGRGHRRRHAGRAGAGRHGCEHADNGRTIDGAVRSRHRCSCSYRRCVGRQRRCHGQAQLRDGDVRDRRDVALQCHAAVYPAQRCTAASSRWCRT